MTTKISFRDCFLSDFILLISFQLALPDHDFVYQSTIKEVKITTWPAASVVRETVICNSISSRCCSDDLFSNGVYEINTEIRLYSFGI